MKYLKIMIFAILLAPFLFNNCTSDDCNCIGNIDTIYVHQIDTICIGDGAPYLTYSSKISQSGNNNPTESLLANELNLSINWIRLDKGKYEGVLSNPIDLDKTTLSIQLQETDKIPTGGFKDSITIQLHILNRFNLYDTKDGFVNAQLEINKYLK